MILLIYAEYILSVFSLDYFSGVTYLNKKQGEIAHELQKTS